MALKLNNTNTNNNDNNNNTDNNNYDNTSSKYIPLLPHFLGCRWIWKYFVWSSVVFERRGWLS